jgi:ankyrin repeat protein
MYNLHKCGWTAVFYAASEGYLDVLQLLHESGADIHLKDKVYIPNRDGTDSATYCDGRSVLMYAAGEGHTNVVRYLLKNGSDTEAKDHVGIYEDEYIS